MMNRLDANDFLNELSKLCRKHKIWISPKDPDGEERIVSFTGELPVYFSQVRDRYEIDE